MNIDIASDTSLKTRGSSGNLRFNHVVDPWTVGESESENYVAPMGEQAGQSIVYNVLPTSAFLDPGFRHSWDAAAAIAQKYIAPATFKQFTAWYSNPNFTADYGSHMSVNAHTYLVVDLHSTLSHKTTFGEHKAAKQWYFVEKQIDLANELAEVSLWQEENTLKME